MLGLMWLSRVDIVPLASELETFEAHAVGVALAPPALAAFPEPARSSGLSRRFPAVLPD